MSENPPAGWYADGNGQRYWDGHAWTESRAPGSPKRRSAGNGVGSVLIGLIAGWVAFVSPFAWILVAVGIALGVSGLLMNRTELDNPRTWAILGLVINGVAALLTLMVFLFP